MDKQECMSGEMSFAIIEGVPIALPPEAKYVVQDMRGCWFYANRKPRKKEGDWTPLKHPIQINTSQGYQRVLRTDPMVNWEDSIQMIVTESYLPTSHGEAYCNNQLVN